MSDVQNTPVAPTEADQAIASLKKQADRLGISYKSNTSIATLQKQLQKSLMHLLAVKIQVKLKLLLLLVQVQKVRACQLIRTKL